MVKKLPYLGYYEELQRITMLTTTLSIASIHLDQKATLNEMKNVCKDHDYFHMIIPEEDSNTRTWWQQSRRIFHNKNKQTYSVRQFIIYTLFIW